MYSVWMILMVPEAYFKACFTGVTIKFLLVNSNLTANAGFISHIFCLKHFW